jgi:hypothetical protein
MIATLAGLGVLGYLIGTFIARADTPFLPLLALLVADVGAIGGTVALASSYPRNAYRMFLLSGGLFLAAAVLSGLPFGIPIAVSAAVIWGVVVRLNRKLKLVQ